MTKRNLVRVLAFALLTLLGVGAEAGAQGLSGHYGNAVSALTRPSNTTAYSQNDLIASSVTAGSIVVPALPLGPSGGAVVSRVRLSTNATTGWDAVVIQVSLWRVAPTYTNGDNGAYAVATGGAGLLAQYNVTLAQYADAATGQAVPTVGTQPVLQLYGGATNVYWDMKITSAAGATPTSGQVFTLTAELTY